MITDTRVDDADLLARDPERSLAPIIGDSKCHPGVAEFSGGLCAGCWPRRHEADDKIIAAKREHQRETQARWYAENAERKKATQKAQYRRLCDEAKAAGMKTYVYRKSRP